MSASPLAVSRASARTIVCCVLRIARRSSAFRYCVNSRAYSVASRSACAASPSSTLNFRMSASGVTDTLERPRKVAGSSSSGAAPITCCATRGRRASWTCVRAFRSGSSGDARPGNSLSAVATFPLVTSTSAEDE